LVTQKVLLTCSSVKVTDSVVSGVLSYAETSGRETSSAVTVMSRTITFFILNPLQIG